MGDRGVIRAFLRQHFLRTATYEGSNGTTWFAGSVERAPSVAAYFSGDDAGRSGQGFTWRKSLPRQISQVAGNGGLSIVSFGDRDPGAGALMEGAIQVPKVVDIHTDLPDDLEALRDELRTSTTKEDLRRIRRAEFTYRVTSDPGAVREFHAQHYLPLVEQQYPEDGRILSVQKLLDALEDGGELVCADHRGRWVAGILNLAGPNTYALTSFGIRDADAEIRNKRVTSALIVRSLERAVELGYPRATMGRSLPFLGKGPVWFKVKWNGVVSWDPVVQSMYMFLDLRHASTRRMLASNPVVHIRGEELVASAWLEPGEKPLQRTLREVERFPGVQQWHVLGEPETLTAGKAELAKSDVIVPIPVVPGGKEPTWLGRSLPAQ